MAEHHHNHHDHHHDLKGKSLIITIVLNMAITVVQVVGAIFSHSLSLFTDALHNFSDVMALVISYVANLLSKRKFTADKSFGYKRAEIIAAFINAATLLALSVYLIGESVSRLFDEDQALVNGTVVAYLAGFSIAANGISVLVVKRFSKESMNMRSAYLHLFSDMLSSIAVLLGGIAMRIWGVSWIDAILSIGIAIYLIISSWKLFVQTLKVLMQFTPSNVDIEGIAHFINGINGVGNLHHVHVWQLNDKEYHFEGHLDFDTNLTISKANEVMAFIEKKLSEDYHISHCTLQPEFGVCDDKALVKADHGIKHGHNK